MTPILNGFYVDAPVNAVYFIVVYNDSTDRELSVLLNVDGKEDLIGHTVHNIRRLGFTTNVNGSMMMNSLQFADVLAAMESGPQSIKPTIGTNSDIGTIKVAFRKYKRLEKPPNTPEFTFEQKIVKSKKETMNTPISSKVGTKQLKLVSKSKNQIEIQSIVSHPKVYYKSHIWLTSVGILKIEQPKTLGVITIEEEEVVIATSKKVNVKAIIDIENNEKLIEFQINLESISDFKSLKLIILQNIENSMEISDRSKLREMEFIYKYMDNEGDETLIKERITMDEIKEHAMYIQVESKSFLNKIKRIKRE